MYGVDHEIGAAIKESGIPRSEIFVTTKFWPHFAAPENVELCLDLCLKQMNLDYVDLWLAHWPYAAKPISRAALEKAKCGPDTTPEDQGKLMDGDKPVIDWEHTSTNIAKQRGESCARASMLSFLLSIRTLISFQERKEVTCPPGRQCKSWSRKAKLAPLGSQTSPSQS